MRRILLILLLAACAEREASKPPVVIISIDTLRSDRLAAYGYRGTQTPNIDRLAADGIVFENAWAHVPLTLPSHASVMTGLLPPEHGVRDNGGSQLDAKTPTIASLLKAHGYATGGAVSAYVLRGSTGMGAGFDVYDDRIAYRDNAPTGALSRGGRETVSIARDWLMGNASKPFLLFVHLFEPHAPYEPSYDGEITKVDEAVGELLDAVRITKRYDDSLIILLSDHGEGLRDHGEQEHGVLLYREALQVPLIVKLPKSARRGTRVKELAQLIDVFPAIAEATGIAVPANARGKSLLGDLGARTSYAETLYPRIHLGWSELRSAVKLPHHLIDGPKPELYRVSSDPREQRNVLDAERRVAAELRAEIKVDEQKPIAIAAEEETKKLAALGYVSAGPTRMSNLNPRDHLADLDELKVIQELMTKREFATATKHIERLLVRNPGWSDLRDQLGVAYESMGDLAAAERAYRQAIATTPELASEFALSLAQVLYAQRRIDEAEKHAEIAMRANAPAARLVIARVRAARQDYDGALDELRNIGMPKPARYDFVLGDVLARMNRTAEAKAAFERAIVADPHDLDAYVALALVQRIEGDVERSRATLVRMVEANPHAQELAARRDAEWSGRR